MYGSEKVKNVRLSDDSKPESDQCLMNKFKESLARPI